MSMYVEMRNDYGRSIHTKASTNYTSTRRISFSWSSDNYAVSLSPSSSDVAASIYGGQATAEATTQVVTSLTEKKQATITVTAYAFNEDGLRVDYGSNTLHWIEPD